MACTGCRKPATAQASIAAAAAPPARRRFGHCPRCLVLSLVALVASMAVMTPTFLIELPPRAGWIRVVPTAVFAVWFLLHFAGFLAIRARRRGR